MRCSSLVLLGTGLLCFGACRREPAVFVDARPAARNDAQPAQPALAAAAPDLLSERPEKLMDPSDPLTVPAIEVSGEVRLPPDTPPPSLLYVYATSGDCLSEQPRLLRRMPVTESGTFLLHLIAQPGSELSLCAAAAPVGDGHAPVSLYGKYPTPVRVGMQREQEFRDVTIHIAPGPPHLFPLPPKAGKAAQK